MRRVMILLSIVAIAAFAGCASVPTGPSVMVLPGTGKSFEQFRIDDAACRQFAYDQVGGSTGQQAAQDAAVTSAVIGTVLGAAAGAAIGSATGDMGAGAAIGAGSGLLLGSAAGTGYASGSYYEAQRRYDNGYLQCMYAKGNRIPVSGRFSSGESRRPNRWGTPPPPDYPPPTRR
jgi:outer membrane lipoprotein SlyB